MAYVLTAWAGQALFIAPALGAALWPPSGLFLATLVLSPRPHRPWFVLAGSSADFLASTLIFGFPVGVSIAIAIGNALEAATGACLLNRWAGGTFRLAGAGAVLAFTLQAALISPLLSMLIGGTVMSFHTAQPLLESWKVWWSGDAAGMLVFAPLVWALLGKREDEPDRPAASTAEVLAVLAALVLAAHVLLSVPYPTGFLLLPILIWAALRGEHRAIAPANAVMTVLVVLYTQHGLGPFAAGYALEMRQFLVQLFILAAALTGLLVAGQACSSRRSAIELAAARAAAETALAVAEAARLAAEQASKAKSTFLANMSHEFRTPLNAVIGFSHLMTTMELSSKASEYAAHIQRAGKHLLALTDDVLDLSSIEAGGLRLEQVPFSLATLLEEVRALVRQQAQDKGLELRLDMEPTLPAMLVGDPLRLKQVLLNLLGNAVKFTSAGGVGLQVRELDRAADCITLCLDVSDTGIGIEPGQRQRIFEAFAQADTSPTREHGGTGLGLSIASRLVEMMGGTIVLDSAVGRGSTFSVTLALRVVPGVSA